MRTCTAPPCHSISIEKRGDLIRDFGRPVHHNNLANTTTHVRRRTHAPLVTLTDAVAAAGAGAGSCGCCSARNTKVVAPTLFEGTLCRSARTQQQQLVSRRSPSLCPSSSVMPPRVGLTRRVMSSNPSSAHRLSEDGNKSTHATPSSTRSLPEDGDRKSPTIPTSRPSLPEDGDKKSPTIPTSHPSLPEDGDRKSPAIPTATSLHFILNDVEKKSPTKRTATSLRRISENDDKKKTHAAAASGPSFSRNGDHLRVPDAARRPLLSPVYASGSAATAPASHLSRQPSGSFHSFRWHNLRSGFGRPSRAAVLPPRKRDGHRRQKLKCSGDRKWCAHERAQPLH